MFLVWAKESLGKIVVNPGCINEGLGLGIPWWIGVNPEEALVVLL